jgi:hypothetical protein
MIYVHLHPYNLFLTIYNAINNVSRCEIQEAMLLIHLYFMLPNQIYYTHVLFQYIKALERCYEKLHEYRVQGLKLVNIV